MANKFILVPQDIYRGLTSADTGDINLDFSRRMLEQAKRQRANASTKNNNTRQELRRFLNLRNQHENKPTKVEVVNGAKILVREGENIDDLLESDDHTTQNLFTPKRIIKRKIRTKSEGNQSDESLDTTFKSVKQPTDEDTSTPINLPPKNPLSSSPSKILTKYEIVNKIHTIFKSDPSKYGISGDQILDKKGNVVKDSDVIDSLNFIFDKIKGKNKALKGPAGTQYLESHFNKDLNLKSMILSPKAPRQSAIKATQMGFHPSKWTNK